MCFLNAFLTAFCRKLPDTFPIPHELNDARLLALASERMAHFDAATIIPEEKVWDRLGITEDDLDSIGEVELE